MDRNAHILAGLLMLAVAGTPAVTATAAGIGSGAELRDWVEVPKPHPLALTVRNTPSMRVCDTVVADGQFGRIRICASSVLPAQSGNTYRPINMVDGNPATAWVEAAANDGRGQAIAYEFEWPMRFQSFEILAGYAKNAKAHKNNVRPRDVRIFADGDFVATVRLQDTMTVQHIRLSEPVTAQVFAVEFASVYMGRKWQDLAVSEFLVDLEELNYQ